RRRVEPLDYFIRDVESGVHERHAGIGREHDIQAFLFRDLVDDWYQLLLELPLQFVVQLLQLGLRVALRELDVPLQLVDVLVELRARRVAQHARARIPLRRQRLQLFVLVLQLRQLFRIHVLQLLRRLLAGRRGTGDLLNVDEGDFRVLRKRRGRLRLQDRRLRGWYLG